MSESCLSMNTKRQNPAGDSDSGLGGFERGCVGAVVALEQFRGSGGRIEFVRVGIVPARLDLTKLFLALKKLVNWIKR
jgi:hypothetical protein